MLVTAANWQVVVIQFVADALFKTLLAVPIVGGVFLVVLLIGGDPSELLESARAIDYSDDDDRCCSRSRWRWPRFCSRWRSC